MNQVALLPGTDVPLFQATWEQIKMAFAGYTLASAGDEMRLIRFGSRHRRAVLLMPPGPRHPYQREYQLRLEGHPQRFLVFSFMLTTGKETFVVGVQLTPGYNFHLSNGTYSLGILQKLCFLPSGEPRIFK